MSVNVLLLLLAILGGASQDPGASTRAPLGEEFKMKIGQHVMIEGRKLSIKFSAVLDESRCPTGVQCVWEGNAGVVVELSKKKKKLVQTTLNTNASIKPNQLEHKGYIIKLVGLNPYPKADQSIDPKDYEAVLVVTKQ
ncbi:MAG: hypothetical protein WAU45_04450 [Blastocatellia bacterium]